MAFDQEFRCTCSSAHAHCHYILVFQNLVFVLLVIDDSSHCNELITKLHQLHAFIIQDSNSNVSLIISSFELTFISQVDDYIDF